MTVSPTIDQAEISALKDSLHESIDQCELARDDLILLRVLVMAFWAARPGEAARQALSALAPGFSEQDLPDDTAALPGRPA